MRIELIFVGFIWVCIVYACLAQRKRDKERERKQNNTISPNILKRRT